MSLIRNLFLSILFALFFVSCASHPAKKFLMSDDGYWERLTLQSTEQKISILKVLQKENPALYKQFENDSKDTKLLGFWGQSFNFDSGAKKKIITDQLISDLQAEFGVHNDNMIVHAGITHTYGYLFSVLNTPYGFKRKRWTDSTLNYAFSFNGSSLSPETMEGSMLSNITYFAGMLAFKHHEEKQSLLALKNISNEVKNFDYSKINVEQVEEDFFQGGILTNILRTSLVRLPFKQEHEENDYWLIYSIYNLKLKREFLITAFPIKKDAYKKITEPESFGANKPISLRYNAYLDGANDPKLVGNRRFYTEALHD